MSKINDYLEKNYIKFPNDIGLIYRENETYKEITNSEIYEFVNSLVAKLNGKYKNVAIIGNNKLEWIISFWAVFGYVGDVIAIDKELDKDNILEIFDLEKPDLVIIDDEINVKFEQYECMYFSQVNEMMKEKTDCVLNDRHSGNLYLHTSGTTGTQKLVKLDEKNLFGVIPELNKKWEVTHKDTCLFIIPLYHIYALTTMFHSMYAGVTIILETDYKRMESVLKETKPTLFMGVPLMYNKIKENILSNNAILIKIMIGVSNILRKVGIDIRKKMFKKIHDFFGGKYFFGCSAGSLLSYDTNKFFDDVGLPIYNVYGMTETSGPVAMNYKNNNDYNSVGKILNINTVKIISENKNGIGEIWVKGSNVFKGYIGNKKVNCIENGYFDTGDMGYIKNDFLYVKGRKKNILIGDNGKNIAPEELIGKLLQYKEINDANVLMKNNRIYVIINTKLEENKVKEIIDKINIKLPKYKKISGYEITQRKIK